MLRYGTNADGQLNSATEKHTEEHMEKGSVELKELWTVGFRYSWKKMEHKTSWMETVGATRQKSSKNWNRFQ